jgi:hypothetical protein
MTHEEKVKELTRWLIEFPMAGKVATNDLATAILAKVESMDLTAPNKTVADLIEAQKIEIMRLREEVRKLKEGA